MVPMIEGYFFTMEASGGGGTTTVGRYLSGWDCTTGQPISFPQTTPYEYLTGDYFIVHEVSDTVNYKPDGLAYDGSASTVEETATVEINDTYFFDGTVWQLTKNRYPELDNYYTKKEIDQRYVSGQLTLTVAGWTNKVQTVSITHLTDDDIIFLSPADVTSKQAMDGANCFVETSGTNVIFTATDTVPTVSVTLDYLIKHGGRVVNE